MKAIQPSALMLASAPAQTSNLQTVQDIYACFGQGDIPGILATLSENVVFVHGANPAIVPFGGTYQGIAGVTEFFQKLGQNSRITVFQPSNFREEGSKVTNDVRVEGTALNTGRTSVEDTLFTWEFDDDGKVARWEGSGDFSNMEAAYQQ